MGLIFPRLAHPVQLRTPRLTSQNPEGGAGNSVPDDGRLLPAVLLACLLSWNVWFLSLAEKISEQRAYFINVS